MKTQLRELVVDHGPLGILWFDGEWEKPWTHARGVDLYWYVRGLQPDIIVNNRVDKGRSGMEGVTKTDAAYLGDYDTPEQRVGKFQPDRPWETCMTICRQWAWKPDDKLKSLDECIGILVNTVGGDGNLLLNVGPMPDGRIEPRQAERLRQMGRWLEANGESIYQTRGGPFKPGPWGASTHRADTVYLHVLKWPDGPLALAPLDKKISGAKLIGGGSVTIKQTGAGITVSVPPADRKPIDTIVVLKLD